MGIKSFLAKPYANFSHKKLVKSMYTAVEDQHSILKSLINNAQHTLYGKEHRFNSLDNYNAFKQSVEIQDYEAMKGYINLIKEGQENVLWKGRPLYFAKTSGTTSGVKYIPISKESIENQVDGARNALLTYMSETGNTAFADGKMIFLSGSPVLERINKIPTGRLSGIVNHHIPSYLSKSQLPSYPTNCIEDWEEKLGKIVDETINQNMSLISGIPPWMQMYFDWILERSGKKNIREVFPKLSILVHGGVNFQPYKHKLYESIGGHIDSIETFPASEGFFAYQNSQQEEGLLLNTNGGIFFEFIPSDEIFNVNPTRLSLDQVEKNVNYAMIINSNAGLWGYNLGDTIKFVSLDPFKIVVTGRTKHFISAFGEHVIGEEVEKTMQIACERQQVKVTEFTVAPMIQTEGELPYHEWFIEFENQPQDLHQFQQDLDQTLREKNIYYNDLIVGNILQPLKITLLQKNAFRDYMKSIGKLGGQNKTPRLSNDRTLADDIKKYELS